MKIKFISPEMEEFVCKYIDSFLHWDLLIFFHHNQGTIDTIEQIAMRLGRRVEDVEKALGDLVERKILNKKREGNSFLFYYSPEKNVKKQIEEFDSSVESRAFRLEVLSLILEKELHY
ncbi:MAG: hypothetical protein KAS39_03465 [Actinomycetia bacterium]|nr:hypothetical protein [Actinomycetes bacterium]